MPFSHQILHRRKSCSSFHLAQTHPVALRLVCLTGSLAVTRGVFQPSLVLLPNGAHKEQRFCSLQGVLFWSLLSLLFNFFFMVQPR